MPRRKRTARTTLINYIIDESGSMWGIADQVRNGFNEYIEQLRDDAEGNVLVTVTKFSTGERELFNSVPLADVPRLDTTNYLPSGSTALYDAVANTVKRVGDVDKDTKVITLIMTDGFENASIENSQKTVSALIKTKQDAGNWTFVFLGADQDAWSAAAGLGIAAGNTMSYASHTHGSTMRGLASATIAHTHSAAATTDSLFSDAGQSVEDYANADEVFKKKETTSSTT